MTQTINQPATMAMNPRQTPEQNRAFVGTYSLSEYNKLTRSESLKTLARDIAAATSEEQQRQLKSRLPYRCPHYTRFTDNHRDRQHIDPESFTFMTCVDIDDAALVDKANEMSERLDMKIGGPWQGMMLHKDYSARRKLHIDIRLPVGMTVAEAQRAYCEALGVEPDTSCFTPERAIFITPDTYEIYRADGWYEPLPDRDIALRRKAYTDRGLTIDGRTKEGAYYDGKSLGSSTFDGQEPDISHLSSLTSHLSFKGIPYSAIIAEYWQRTGGEPQTGERNVKLHKLAVNLRAICDNHPDVLMQVMPRFGLTDMELRQVVESACKEPTKGSRLMDQIVDQLSKKTEEPEVADTIDEALEAETTTVAEPASPLAALHSKLPIGLKESLVGVPPSMHMPVLCAVMPIAAAYADQVSVEYCDGNMQQLGLMAIVRGEQASGKSVCKMAVDLWKRLMDAEDAVSRKREEAWREQKKNRKANEKAPDDPHVLIRVVPVTVSCSTLLKRLKNAQGHTLFSFGEELDTLRKTNGAGSWSSKYDIYRLSFDHGEWGQDYNSDMAESGMVNVAYNWTMLGTNGALRKCFRSDNIENGLSSRVLVAEMPDASFQKMPKFHKRSTAEEGRISQAAELLRRWQGVVNVPRLRRTIEQWVEEKRIEAAKDIDHVKDTYRKRAAVIGFRCGVVFHLLENGMRESKAMRESKVCQDFAVTMAEYCLEQQMKAFGHALSKEFVVAEEECQRRSANHSVFDELQPEFTLDHLRQLKRGVCSDKSLRMIISRWLRDGWIEKVGTQCWRKKDSF